jgi:uncharacterized membrane protein
MVGGLFFPHNQKQFVHIWPNYQLIMDTLELLRLWVKPVHVYIGAIILLCGLLQILMRKSGKVHRTVGKIYVASMLISFLTSFPLSILAQNYFLATIGLFSFHMAFTGARIAAGRRRGHWELTDKAAAILFALSAFWMIAVVFMMAFHEHYEFAVILGVFFGIFSNMAFRDAYYMILKNDVSKYLTPKTWIMHHIGRMIGSYIAAITAFLVNVQPFGQNIINWLLPTLLGVLVMRYFMKKIKPA